MDKKPGFTIKVHLDSDQKLKTLKLCIHRYRAM